MLVKEEKKDKKHWDSKEQYETLCRADIPNFENVAPCSRWLRLCTDPLASRTCVWRSAYVQSLIATDRYISSKK